MWRMSYFHAMFFLQCCQKRLHRSRGANIVVVFSIEGFRCHPRSIHPSSPFLRCFFLFHSTATHSLTHSLTHPPPLTIHHDDHLINQLNTTLKWIFSLTYLSTHAVFLHFSSFEIGYASASHHVASRRIIHAVLDMHACIIVRIQHVFAKIRRYAIPSIQPGLKVCVCQVPAYNVCNPSALFVVPPCLTTQVDRYSANSRAG